ATPGLVERIHIGGFSDARNLSSIVLVGPSYDAIRPSECAEVEGSADPKFGMHVSAFCLKGVAGDPAKVVDAGGCSQIPSARVSEIKDVIPLRLPSFLGRRNRN